MVPFLTMSACLIQEQNKDLAPEPLAFAPLYGPRVYWHQSDLPVKHCTALWVLDIPWMCHGCIEFIGDLLRLNLKPLVSKRIVLGPGGFFHGRLKHSNWLRVSDQEDQVDQVDYIFVWVCMKGADACTLVYVRWVVKFNKKCQYISVQISIWKMISSIIAYTNIHPHHFLRPKTTRRTHLDWSILWDLSDVPPLFWPCRVFVWIPIKYIATNIGSMELMVTGPVLVKTRYLFVAIFFRHFCHVWILDLKTQKPCL